MRNMTGVINDELQLTGNLQGASNLEGTIAGNGALTGSITGARGPKGEKGDKGDKGDPGTTDYLDLINKPQIEGVILEGNKTLEELGIVVDDTLSSSSTHLVTNQAVSQAIDSINSRMPLVENKTTREWNNQLGYVPPKGTIIIYSDYSQEEKTIDGVPTVFDIPNFKIGDGSAYVQDLPFINDDLRKDLDSHIRNANIHVTLADKLLWSNKINVDDNQEVVDEILVINRN